MNSEVVMLSNYLINIYVYHQTSGLQPWIEELAISVAMDKAETDPSDGECLCVLSLQRNICNNSPVAQRPLGKSEQENVRARAWEECYDLLNSGSDMAIVCIHSQQLWLTAEDLYKIKLVRAPSWIERELLR